MSVDASGAVAPIPFDPNAFYRDLLQALDDWQRRKEATPRGAVSVVKRVALEHGVPLADRLPLPRLNRTEMDELGALGASWRRERGIR